MASGFLANSSKAMFSPKDMSVLPPASSRRTWASAAALLADVAWARLKTQAGIVGRTRR